MMFYVRGVTLYVDFKINNLHDLFKYVLGTRVLQLPPLWGRPLDEELQILIPHSPHHHPECP